jgi:RNA polymerase sigma-70 factor (ECF subfamily)
MSTTVAEEEFAIIKKCLAGNAEHYSVLVDRNKDMAYNIAFRMLGDADVAKDMAQESFIAAYNALGDFKFNSKFSSWLYRIVVNKCRDHFKAGRETVPVDDICDYIAGQDPTPEQAASCRQTGDVVQQALNRLPPDYREVIILKHIEGHDYQEIAAALGVSISALKVRAHRGREMLKKLLEGAGVTL